jgi:hypothetical protein
MSRRLATARVRSGDVTETIYAALPVFVAAACACRREAPPLLEGNAVNDFNKLMHALRDRGGFATTAELNAVRPRIKNLVATQIDVVERGFGVWVGPDVGSQELELTDHALEMMSSGSKKMTTAELREAIERGDNLSGYTIFIRRERTGLQGRHAPASAGEA